VPAGQGADVLGENSDGKVETSADVNETVRTAPASDGEEAQGDWQSDLRFTHKDERH
jgi:hypothetical protein